MNDPEEHGLLLKQSRARDRSSGLDGRGSKSHGLSS